jgi:hypothetical protein
MSINTLDLQVVSDAFLTRCELPDLAMRNLDNSG